MSDELAKAKEKLLESQQQLFEIQRSIAESIAIIDFLMLTPAAEPAPEAPTQRTPTHVVGRDSRGEILALDGEGKILYKASAANTFEAPFTLYLADGEGVIEKMYVDSPAEWLIERQGETTNG